MSKELTPKPDDDQDDHDDLADALALESILQEGAGTEHGYRSEQPPSREDMRALFDSSHAVVLSRQEFVGDGEATPTQSESWAAQAADEAKKLASRQRAEGQSPQIDETEVIEELRLRLEKGAHTDIIGKIIPGALRSAEAEFRGEQSSTDGERE